MLDILLKAPKDKRKVMAAKINAGTRRRIFDKIYTMTEELGLDDVPDYETRVKMRYELIQRFPTVVFWDYAEHATADSVRVTDEIPDFERYDYCKVSTRGDVVFFTKQKRLAIYVSEPKNRYQVVCLNDKHKRCHRLIASTFIPKPDRFNDISHRQLQVNHIDGTRWCNTIENLEWVSDKENRRHRYHIDRYHEEKYFLFKVAVDNGFMGREFVLPENGLHILGIDFTNIRKVISYGNSIFKGFYVVQIECEDIGNTYVGLPPDIAALLNQNHRYFSVCIKPVIGTVLRGKFKGMEFSLFGNGEVGEYFRTSNTYAAAGGRIRYHYGCAFRWATHQEAIPLHGKLTKEIADDARNAKDP